MIDLTEFTVMIVALMPLAFLLIIWSIEYLAKKLMIAGGWLLGTIGLNIMGRDI